MINIDNEIKCNEEDVALTDNEDKKIYINPKRFTCNQHLDGGYAWVILVAGFILVVLVTSTGSLFGLIFIHKIKTLNMSSFSVALAFNIRSFLWSLTSTMSGPLCEQFGWRKVGITGAFLCSLAVFLTCYATSVVSVNVYFSIFNGLGGGLGYSTCLFVVSNYFIRMRGFAMAVMGSGFAVGQLVLPFFIRYLQENYGFQGAALILSAFLLNGIVAAACFHHLEWHKEKVVHGKNISEKQIAYDKYDDTQINDIEAYSSSKFRFIGGAITKFSSIFRKVIKLTYINIVNLKSPVVAIISFSGGCMIISFLNVMLMLPLSFVSIGLSLQEAAYCFSLIGISILVFRIIIPILSDFKAFKTTFCYVAGQFLIAVSCFAFTFTSQFSQIALCFGFFGAGIGSSMGLQPIIFIDYKGLKELPRTYGSFGFVNALLFIFLGTSLGYIRDATGSYVIMYRMFSGVLLFSGLIWILMPFALSYEKRKQELEEHSDN